MPMDLAALVDPRHTAFVTQECQNGVIGERSVLPQLAEVARAGMLPNAARLASAAREAGIPVIHCVVERRPDGRGSNTNARLFMAVRKAPVQLLAGTEAVEVVPEIGTGEADFVLTRYHGIGPMWGTDLDPILRNLGIRTLVAVGVSVNVGMTNLVMDAVNAGYQVVVPRDAVAGIPPEYADAVIDNTLAYIATIVRTEDVLGVWQRVSEGAEA